MWAPYHTIYCMIVDSRGIAGGHTEIANGVVCGGYVASVKSYPSIKFTL